MDSDSWISWLPVALLLMMAAYFAVSETAVTSVSRIRLRARFDRGDSRAKKALYVQDNFDQAISAILIGTNIVHISTATLVTLLVTRTWGASWVALGTVLCTLTVFFAGEMLPKTIAKRYSERCALATASSLCFFMRVFSPFTRALAKTGDFFTRIIGGASEVTVTEDELYDLIDDMTDRGSLDEEQGELVSNALEFAEVSVEHVLTPRVDVTALSVSEAPAAVFELVRTARHSRIPVYEGTIDNIIGVLQVRRYVKAYFREGTLPELRSLLDEPCFVHESAGIHEVLEEMSRRKLNLAVVMDSYGGTMGIITVEDILEELVGEIWDEDDIAHEDLIRTGENVWEADAELDMEDLFDGLDYEDPSETEWNRESVGEWVYRQFDMLPAEGSSFIWYRLRVTVLEMSRRRVLKLRVELLPENAEGGNEE